VRAAAAAAAAEGAGIVIEHLNPVEVDRPLLGTPAEAAAFVVAVDHPGVRLLYDAYHAARAGLDPLAALGPVSPLVGHVQYADCPGRGAPGTGGIDLEALVERLDALGYAGAVGLEFVPSGRTADALSAPAVRRLIRPG
jgi:hydroxypyruvate isomerase